MDAERLIDSLARFRKVLPALVADLPDQDARWRPPSGNWSVLEIVCHLADEEVEDFRRRVQLILTNPSEAWPPIDPEAAAVERKYNEADLEESTNRFLTERTASIEMLRGLADPDWSQAHDHPKFGLIHAGEVLAAWAAHDHLHSRQISKRLFEITGRDASPYGTEYAGDWGA